MDKLVYEAPRAEVFRFEAERGFAPSGVTASVADFDRQPWSATPPQEADEEQ